MSEKTRLALGILAASMLLGLVGNWLLWASDWGINMGLWLAIAVAVVFTLQRAGARPVCRAAAARRGETVFRWLAEALPVLEGEAGRAAAPGSKSPTTAPTMRTGAAGAGPSMRPARRCGPSGR